MFIKTFPKLASRLDSIRTQLILGFGSILILALIIAVIGYLSLRNLQESAEITLEEASRIRELSLEIENEFLLARQNEASFLTRWREIGFESAKALYVTENQQNLAQARLKLDELTRLLQTTADDELKQVLSVTADLQPLLAEYEIAFLTTVDQLAERSRANGLEQALRNQLDELGDSVGSFGETELNETVLLIRANEQAYFNTGQQEFLDNIRLLVNRFRALVETSSPGDVTAGSTERSATELIRQVDTYFSVFNQLVTLEQDIDTNIAFFQDVTQDISQFTTAIGEDGEAGLDRAKTALQATSAQSTVALIITALLALSVGGGTAFLLARRINSRLGRLSLAAQQFGQGNLEQVVTITGYDEFASLANVFNDMAAQLRGTIGSLEKMVTNRTRRLALVTTISERLNAILNLDELLVEVVNQVKEQFGYYHAHIYLLDESQGRLVVAEGTGDAGAELKEKRHNIPLDAPTSLVARAARTNEIVRVDDVRQAEDWLANPLLPGTYAEMAVPIVVDGKVVGVLDVQEDELGGLDDGDANVLRSLSNQVAIAIRNARLFEQVETALAEARAAQEQYLERSWQQARISHSGRYVYARPGAPRPNEKKTQPLTEAHLKAISHEPAVNAINGSDSDPKPIVAPISFRNKKIGALELQPTEYGQPWTEDDLAIVEAVADQFAQMADNVRLFEETLERAGREHLIGEVSDKMRRATDMEELMETVVGELSHIFGADRVFVRLTPTELEGRHEQNGRLSNHQTLQPGQATGNVTNRAPDKS